MKYSHSHKGFGNEGGCGFCNRGLGENTFFLSTDEGLIVAAGPGCAKKNAGKPPSDLFDFKVAATKLIASNKNHEVEAKIIDVENLWFEYLTLRIHCLEEFELKVTSNTSNIYSKCLDGSLSPDDVKYVRNLIKKTERDIPLLSMRNLICCYGFEYWIKALIKKFPRNDKFKGYLEYLHKKLYLSRKQILEINKWLEVSGNKIRLEYTSFDWAK